MMNKTCLVCRDVNCDSYDCTNTLIRELCDRNIYGWLNQTARLCSLLRIAHSHICVCHTNMSYSGNHIKTLAENYLRQQNMHAHIIIISDTIEVTSSHDSLVGLYVWLRQPMIDTYTSIISNFLATQNIGLDKHQLVILTDIAIELLDITDSLNKRLACVLTMHKHSNILDIVHIIPLIIAFYKSSAIFPVLHRLRGECRLAYDELQKSLGI